MIEARVQALISQIQRSRLARSDEKRLQTDLFEVLSAKGIEFVREPHLSKRDIPDFVVNFSRG